MIIERTVQMKLNTFRSIALAAISASAMVFLVSCGAPQAAASASPSQAAATEAPAASASSAPETKSAAAEQSEQPADSSTKIKAEITMEDGGVMALELDKEAAPLTVENFVNLVEEGFYDGLTFHRIIPDFMIQGGDPTGTGTGDSDSSIKGEFAENGWDNPISHKRGVISMARSLDPDSASCQFFITNADSVFLDGQYAAFGHVTSGMEVVDQISAVERDASDKPLEDVVIKTIKIVE